MDGLSAKDQVNTRNIRQCGNSETDYGGKAKRKRCVFSLDLKVLREFAVLTDK